MRRLKDGWLCRPRLGVICTLVFHRSVIFVFLTHRCGGQPQVVGPSEPIVATVGDDIMLPCHLSPAVDASDQTVEWARPDLNPRFVYVWRDGVELKSKKHPFYVERTSLHVSKLKHGDISLKLSKVKLSDEGTYRCFIPTMNRDSSVQLVVGTVSSLIINLMRTENDEEVVLHCESKGWYPEPEVFWLDGEGNLLSAGPTETVRGPDDLYTVSRRLTVEKSDNFTCRVQQKNINQTRETHIYIPDDFFSPPCNSAAHIITIISLAVGFMVTLTGVFVVWTWRRKQHSCNFTTKTTRRSNNTELPHLLVKEKSETLQVMSESSEDLDEKKTKLDEQLNEVQEKYKEVVGVVNILMNHRMDLKNHVHLLVSQHGARQREENNIKHTEKECLDTTTNPDIVKKDLDKEVQDANTNLTALLYAVTILTEKKTEFDNLMNQINKQLEEINDQRDKFKGN